MEDQEVKWCISIRCWIWVQSYMTIYMWDYVDISSFNWNWTEKSYTSEICCDYKASLHITSNSVYHKRIRLNVNSFGIRFRENLIFTGFLKIEEQLADMFTKALNGARVNYVRSSWHYQYPYFFLRASVTEYYRL